jgi:hypothetical protein
VPAPHYQQSADALAAGLPAETGFGPAQFAGQSRPSANGHGGSGQHALSHLPPGPSAGAPGMMGNGLAQPGLPGPAIGGMPAPGPNGGLAAGGQSQRGPAADYFGAGPAGLDQPAPPAPAQHGLAQPGLGQQGQTAAAQPGAHRQTGGGPGGPQGQNSLMPIESQRPSLPARQLPAGGGLPYGQDQRMPYADQLQQPQFGGPNGLQPYQPGGYGGQPAQLPSSALSVGDAVQSAHAEGFGFGEAVARDAPALWLEAVLARKPRMPSDLEARLLQGSALPIDSLLDDEVRHALRRGFWDALERSRH